MENKRENRNKKIFISIIVVFSIIYSVLAYKNIINLSILTDIEDLSNHFNFVTVNSVFLGFLLSSLSLILGFSSINSIVKLENGGYMKNIYDNITLGILFSFMSIISSLIMIFMGSYLQKYTLLINKIIPGIELLGLLLTIIVFFKAVIDVRFIIKVVRNEIKRNDINESEIKETLKLLNKKPS